MVSLLTQNQKPQCCVEIGKEGIAVACISNQEKPKITLCSFNSCQNKEQIKQCLLDIVSKNNLKKFNCSWVLHPDQYNITLANTPNVPKTEYKNAVRWQMKNFINYPLEDVVVDVFCIDEAEKNPKKIYAIAAQNSFLQNIVNIIQECYLQSVAIDIREFAIRNLLSALALSEEAIGFLDIVDDSCLLVIVSQDRVRFVRRIPFGISKVKENAYEELSGELQRSFNYCLIELKQKVPEKFFTAPSMKIDSNVIQNIAKSINREVAILEIQKVLNFNTPITLETESRCWAAIGGVLRK